MALKWFNQENNQIIMHTNEAVCSTKQEVVHSDIFLHIIDQYIERLQKCDSPKLAALPFDATTREGRYLLVSTLRSLCDFPLERLAQSLPQGEDILAPAARQALDEFVAGLYDFWRSFDRFLVLHGEPGPSSLDSRPYRAFNATAEALTHLIRSAYRDVRENITGSHPRVYRQVAAGCNVALIAVPRENQLPPSYRLILDDVPFIRQVWITPPMIIDPPMNKRTGQFQKVMHNPIEGLKLTRRDWLCYPAIVGPLTIFVYFHQRFIGLGSALANLFELATDEQVAAGPDALYVFGAPPSALAKFGELPTVFYDDEANGLLVAAVPGEDKYGYFGYLKKMILTLHNIVMMKRGRMPYHGAMVHMLLRNGRQANILLIGDTAAGKSESLEAFRVLGSNDISELRIVADDMGSLEVTSDGRVIAYGTEIGAFVRLDDLQQGYAFGQIDRAIIMSPQKVNARVVLPVTTIEEVLRGYPVDFILYANNYQEVDDQHPILERFDELERALKVFRDGAAMGKGTTTSSGLNHSYFANIFGPPQYRELHESLAIKTFDAALRSGVWIGELRTRLAIPGYETKGPEEAARALLEITTNGQWERTTPELAHATV